MTFLRNYFLYLYYWGAKNDNPQGEPDKFKGFVGVSIFVIPAMLIPIVELVQTVLLPELTNWFDSLRGVVITKTHKGDINLYLVFYWVLGHYITKFTCTYELDFEDIPKRLEKTKYFNKRSFMKLMLMSLGVIFLLWALFFIIVGNFK